MKLFGKRRAAALIFVLGLIAITGIVAAVIVEFASVRLKPRASSMLEQQLKLDADSALNAAVAVLREYAEIDGGLYSESQGWSRPLSDGRIVFDGCEVDVKISDESGKIPLGIMDAESFVKLFEEWGIGSAWAQQAADCIIDWSDSDDARGVFGAEYEDYERGAARPPNRSIKSFSELAFIENAKELFFDDDGNPTELYTLFSENFSTENFSKVNLNSASEKTLEILCVLESEDYDVDLYRAIRGEIGTVDDGKYWVENLTDIENRGARFVPRKNVGVNASLLKIEITVRRGIAEYRLIAFYGQDSSSSSGSDGARRTGGASTGGSSTSRPQGSGGNAGDSSGVLASQSSRSASSKGSSSLKILKIYERGMLQ